MSEDKKDDPQPTMKEERKFTLDEAKNIYWSAISQGVMSPKESNVQWQEMMNNYFKKKFNIDL